MRSTASALRTGVWRAGGVPRNTAFTAARALVRFGTAFVLLPILIDRLGAQRTGLFIFATTLTGYFTAIELGLGTSVTKYVAEFRATGAMGSLNSVLRSSLLLMIALGAVAALVLAVLAAIAPRTLFDERSLRGQVAPALLVAAATTLAYWPSRLGVAALNGLERYDLSALLGIVSSLLTFGGAVAITGVTTSVPLLVLFFGVVLVLEGSVAAVLAWPALGIRRGAGVWWGRHLRPVLGFGGALFLIGISDTLIYSLDRTVVAAFVGASAVVVYEVALRPQSAVRTISSLAGGALVSTISRLVAQGRQERVRELVLTGSFLNVVVATPFAVLVIILARPLIHAWVGRSYVEHADLVRLFAAYWLIGANTGVLGSAITGIGRLRVFVILTLAGAIVTLLLSIALTAVWGTIGVILGTVVTAAVSIPIFMHYALRHVHVSKGDYLRDVVLPGYGLIAVWSGAATVVAHLVRPGGVAGVALFGLAALASFWLAALPLVRRRWRRALGGGLATVETA